jgi:hypothetical protein
MAVDASQVLGSSVLAGVKVNPWGAMRRAEARQVGPAVSGPFVVALGDAIGGKAGARERQRLGQLASVTPEFGKVGFVAVTETEVALITTNISSGLLLTTITAGQLVARAPRRDVASVKLGGGWPHIGYYVLTAAPLTITFHNGTAWQMEVSRFFRKNGRKVVRALAA